MDIEVRNGVESAYKYSYWIDINESVVVGVLTRFRERPLEFGITKVKGNYAEISHSLIVGFVQW